MKENNLFKLANLFILLNMFFPCCQNSVEKKIEKAEKLNEKALEFQLSDDSIKLNKAITLFDSAIMIKPDFFPAYWNKLPILKKMNQNEAVISTLKEMEKFYPHNPEYKLQMGIYLEKIEKYEEAQNKYFEAECLYRNILDTLQLKNSFFSTYFDLIINRGCNMKLIGNDSLANVIFNKAFILGKDSTLINIVSTYKHMDRSFLINRGIDNIIDSTSHMISLEQWIKRIE